VTAAESLEDAMSGTPTFVNDVMAKRVVSLRAGAVFKDIVKAMHGWQVSALPVLDDSGVVIGVVSEADRPAKEEYSGGDIGRYGQVRYLTEVRKKDIAEDVRREAVARLFGTRTSTIRVEVHDGVVTLAGRVHETALVPPAARLARAVPGVVDVRCALAGPPRHPNLDPDLPEAERPAHSEAESAAQRRGR
jgi:CBS-domain-containing membrane protein